MIVFLPRLFRRFHEREPAWIGSDELQHRFPAGDPVMLLDVRIRLRVSSLKGSPCQKPARPSRAASMGSIPAGSTTKSIRIHRTADGSPSHRSGRHRRGSQQTVGIDPRRPVERISHWPRDIGSRGQHPRTHRADYCELIGGGPRHQESFMGTTNALIEGELITLFQQVSIGAELGFFGQPVESLPNLRNRHPLQFVGRNYPDQDIHAIFRRDASLGEFSRYLSGFGLKNDPAHDTSFRVGAGLPAITSPHTWKSVGQVGVIVSSRSTGASSTFRMIRSRSFGFARSVRRGRPEVVALYVSRASARHRTACMRLRLQTTIVQWPGGRVRHGKASERSGNRMRALLGNGNWRTRLPPVHPGAVLRHDFLNRRNPCWRRRCDCRDGTASCAALRHERQVLAEHTEGL